MLLSFFVREAGMRCLKSLVLPTGFESMHPAPEAGRLVPKCREKQYFYSTFVTVIPPCIGKIYPTIMFV